MKMEIEIEEQEIIDAVNQKVKLAISEQTRTWGFEGSVKERVRAQMWETIDKLIAKDVEDSEVVKRQIMVAMEAEIKRKLKAALKLKEAEI